MDTAAVIGELRRDVKHWGAWAETHKHAPTLVASAQNRIAALEDAIRVLDQLRTERRRNVAAAKVIAREFHDANGDPKDEETYPVWVHEIGDILVGLKDDEIAASIDAAQAQRRAISTTHTEVTEHA